MKLLKYLKISFFQHFFSIKAEAVLSFSIYQHYIVSLYISVIDSSHINSSRVKI